MPLLRVGQAAPAGKGNPRRPGIKPRREQILLLIQALHDMRKKAVGVLLRRTRSRARIPARAKPPHVVIDLEVRGRFTRP